MTDLEKAKIDFSDASINLEIAQGKYNEAKARLVRELNKPPALVPKELGKENKDGVLRESCKAV